MLTGPALALGLFMNAKLLFPYPTNPPFCPNPDCRFHHHQPDRWPYQKYGSFRRKHPPHTIQRFRCKACQRTFSTQTFCTTYWLKRSDLLPRVFKHTVAGSANRQLARAIGCSSATVDRMIGRLGRHCLLYHRHLMEKASPFGDIAIDGLVTFERSQYFPFEHLVAVDRKSGFFIHFTDAALRRSGSMTDYQKRRRQELEKLHGRSDPQAVEKATRSLLEVALQGAIKATVWSDKHRAYPRAIRWIHRLIDHQRIDSRIKRDRNHELFEINLLDLLLRHCLKNHTRETIAFSKRRQESAYRLAILLVWKNCIKRRWEKRCRWTAAMELGLLDRPLSEKDVLERRLFVTRIELCDVWSDYYWRRVETVAQKVNRRHELKYST
jgi:transposase-like protein